MQVSTIGLWASALRVIPLAWRPLVVAALFFIVAERLNLYALNQVMGGGLGLWNLAAIEAWNILSGLIGSYVLFGLCASAIRAARSEEVGFSALLIGWDAFLRGLAVSALLTLAIAGGALLLLVPGALAAVTWMLALPIVLDGEGKILESFSISAKLTRGRRWSIFWAFFVPLALTNGVALVFLVPQAMQFDPERPETLQLRPSPVFSVLELATGVFLVVLVAVTYEQSRARHRAAEADG